MRYDLKYSGTLGLCPLKIKITHIDSVLTSKVK